MSRDALGPNASRSEIVAHLKEWLRVQGLRGAKKGTLAKWTTLIDSLTEEAGESWKHLCDALLPQNQYKSLRSHLGVWSNLRLRSGKSWLAINAMTRFMRSTLMLDAYAMPTTPGVRTWPNGVGCVSLDGEFLWLADHLHYGTLDGMEPLQDNQFYGYSADPDFSAMSPGTHGWGYLQSKWFRKLGGDSSSGGWLNSPRYLFPVRAHRISRQVLMALPEKIGSDLWSAAGEISALCASTITAKPAPWWQDKDLLPAGRTLAHWARSNHSRGHGVISSEGITARDVSDPCYLPTLLTSIAPGQPTADQLWQLIQLLINQLSALTPADVSGNRWNMWSNTSVPELSRRLAKRQFRTVITTDYLVNVLSDMRLVPVFESTSGVMQLPATSMLRAGLWDYLSHYAVPVISTETKLDRGLGNLQWSWNINGTKGMPDGYQAVDKAEVDEILTRPGSSEVGGNLNLKP